MVLIKQHFPLLHFPEVKTTRLVWTSCAGCGTVTSSYSTFVFWLCARGCMTMHAIIGHCSSTECNLQILWFLSLCPLWQASQVLPCRFVCHKKRSAPHFLFKIPRGSPFRNVCVGNMCFIFRHATMVRICRIHQPQKKNSRTCRDRRPCGQMGSLHQSPGHLVRHKRLRECPSGTACEHTVPPATPRATGALAEDVRRFARICW